MAPIRMITEMNVSVFMILVLSSLVFGTTIILDTIGVQLPDVFILIKLFGGILYLVPFVVLTLLVFSDRIETGHYDD